MRLRALFFGLGLAVLVAGARLVAQPPETAATTNSTADVEKTEVNIARVTGALLQGQHFSHHPLDGEIANRFMDRYLDALDHSHSCFLQSDLDEFDHYRANLDRLTLKGDTTPGRVIFARFMERFRQRYQYVTNLLATETFEFVGNDRYVPDRHTLSAPKDLAEAKELWRQELRFEYLQEKLQAADIKYAGSATLDSDRKAVIRVIRDKAHPLGFEFLPKQVFDQTGVQIASVSIENESNAVVRLPLVGDERLKKVDRKLFSIDGKELGKLMVRQLTNEVVGASNGVAATDGNTAPSTNSLYGSVIQLNQKNMADVVKALTNRHTRLLKNFNELDRDDVFEIYMTSLSRAYDPHSDYMNDKQAENFAISMRLSLFGIGAILQSEDGYCKVAELTPEGPASKSGKIKPGDRIVAVAQADKDPVDVVGMKLSKVVEQIRGPKGTVVRLTVIPASSADSSARQVTTLIRDEIKLVDQAAKAMIYEVPTEKAVTRLGVIDLPLFYADTERRNADRGTTTTDVGKLLTRLKKENVSGVVLDLRRNGGGFLEEAISLTGLFITKGPVVQTKEPTGEIITSSDPDPSVLYDGPLIVLTSRFSASASEILAGALQDYGRALIIGDRSTFGKGTVQNLQHLAPYLDHSKLMHVYDPGELKMTIRKFYRAGGASTQLKGVIPDIELPSVLSYWDVGEAALEYPMPWDEVPSADPENLNRVKPYLASLQKRSAQRLESDKDFAYICEDIEQYKKSLTDKSVSLNEAARLKEKKENEARQEARKKERLSRSKSVEKVYEITLKNVESPELMPPVVKTNALAAALSDPFDLPDDLPSGDSKAADPNMEETKRILVDYVSALTHPQISANSEGQTPASH